MRAATGLSTLARIFLVAGFGVALFAAPASAQKKGGSITVGLELDIPGFDPLKVGVFDTAAAIAAATIFDPLTSLLVKPFTSPAPILQNRFTESTQKSGIFERGRPQSVVNRHILPLSPFGH